jgi:hypothetical protein
MEKKYSSLKTFNQSDIKFVQDLRASAGLLGFTLPSVLLCGRIMLRLNGKFCRSEQEDELKSKKNHFSL